MDRRNSLSQETLVNAPSHHSEQATGILYLAIGNTSLYREVETYLPAGTRLITLESGDEAEILAKIAGCHIVVAGTIKLSRAMIQAAPALQLVVHQGVGYHDTLDVAALDERGIPIAITPDGTPTTVSEHAIMLMLTACRHTAFADKELRDGRYHVNALRLKSRTLSGSVVGIIGMGRIGKATAARLRGWGVTCLYTDPVPLSPDDEILLNARRVDLDTLLSASDIVSLHVPLTDQTRAMIDAPRLARMKAGSILVNTSRGPVVDESALIDALRIGHLGAAGLDVFEREPFSEGNPLAELPNTVLTPHIAAATRDTFKHKMSGVFNNIARHLEGLPLNNRVL